MKQLRIGSRESRLAVIQSEEVAAYLRSQGVDAPLLTMKTTGDIILDRTLDQIGGKGLFVKELDKALLDGRSDLSVHSTKDLPMEIPAALPIVGYSKREDPRDVLVLPQGCTEWDQSKPVGCASPRRALQIRSLYPNVTCLPVRGNVITRLSKLDSGQYGALILAAAGLKRLGLEDRISRYFTTEEMIPAAGQGVLCVQGRANEDYSALDGYFDDGAAACVTAERAFVTTLDGGCSSPIAAFAHLDGETLHLRGLYYSEARSTHTIGTISGPAADAAKLGENLAQKLKEQLDGGTQ